MVNKILEKEKLLQLVLNNIPSFVFWKDRSSKYLGCNLNFALSAGLESPEEIVGKTDYDLPWSKEESDFYRKIDKDVMDSNEAQINFEEAQTVNNESTKWLRTSKIPLHDKNGEVIGILGTYEDITERKQMELELINKNQELKKLNTKLESINIDLEQFTYATSHDLQEPLRMIGGFIGLLERKYLANINEEGLEYLKFIKEGTQRMSSLIRQILSYSKIENTETQNEKADIGLLIEEVLKDLELLLVEKNVKIELNIPQEHIICQPQRIKMVFFNLIMNGIKFNNSIIPVIYIDFENKKSEYYFTVSDNGIGIEKEFQKKIFKPFKRLNTRDKFSGNGIGLSICKRIVNLHEGKIWCTKNKDSGTTFHFTIAKEYSTQSSRKQ